MQITYYSTLYKKQITLNVAGGINFVNDHVEFSSGGHKYAIDFKLIKKIV